MKFSSQTVKDSIMYFANVYGLEINYLELLKATNIPNVVKDLVYLLFINKFCYYNCTDEQYSHYRILLEYSLELEKNGFVEFNKETI
jgi:hypothetical protein